MTDIVFTDYLDVAATRLKHAQKHYAAQHDLQPVHLEIIAYLGRCNRFSDSFLTLCDYLGQTRGTVSQSVALLVRRGLVKRTPDAADGRKQHLGLSRAGTTLLRAYRAHWQSFAADLGPAQESLVNMGLEALVRQLQIASGCRVFGTCERCRFFEHDGSIRRCRLTGLDLTAEDIVQLCAFHEAVGETVSG